MTFESMKAKSQAFRDKLVPLMEGQGFPGEWSSGAGGLFLVPEGRAEGILKSLDLGGKDSLRFMEELYAFGRSDAERWQRERCVHLHTALCLAQGFGSLEEPSFGLLRLPFKPFDVPKKLVLFGLLVSLELVLLP